MYIVRREVGMNKGREETVEKQVTEKPYWAISTSENQYSRNLSQSSAGILVNHRQGAKGISCCDIHAQVMHNWRSAGFCVYSKWQHWYGYRVAF